MAAHFRILAWRIPWTEAPSAMTEDLACMPGAWSRGEVPPSVLVWRRDPQHSFLPRAVFLQTLLLPTLSPPYNISNVSQEFRRVGNHFIVKPLKIICIWTPFGMQQHWYLYASVETSVLIPVTKMFVCISLNFSCTVIYSEMALRKGNHWFKGLAKSIFTLNVWLFSSALRLKGRDESDSGTKQVVMGILDPVLSGARVGTGILLETYNLLTRVVPRVWGSSCHSSSEQHPMQEQLERDKAHVEMES